MDTKPLSKSLSKILEKSRVESAFAKAPVKEGNFEETMKITLADAGTFDTMELPVKLERIPSKRPRNATSKWSENIESNTVFWSQFRRTRENKLKGSFVLPNCVKTFRINIAGVDSEGNYGLFTSFLTVQKLFNVVLKTPPFIRSHEQVKCFIHLDNNQRGDMKIAIPKFKERVEISQGSRREYEFELNPEEVPLKLKLVDCETKQRFFKKVEIPVYRGLCFFNSRTMQVRINRGRASGQETVLQLPSDLIPKTTRIRVEYKQLGIDIIMKGVENLMQQPSGGFEQTCSVAFSLTMLIRYINQIKTKTEKLVNMKIFAEERLDETLEKLQRFECESGGFETFGEGEGNVTLTAYGIWLFSEILEIKKLRDEVLLDRSLQWLRDNYREKGVKFLMKKHLRPDQGYPSQFRSDLYIMFVLTLLKNRFADYKTIVHHKISDYDMKEKKQKLDSYLQSLLSMIYLGKFSNLT